ncbi:uncharacterized protein [Nicotiana sylvestris]|uniref:uncharacterized protein n=1 Tax=Nicotiana sylvestris TaxID=4096 RepID=UPI00388C9718
MVKNVDSDAQLASHNTSIRNLEVQLGQISQALNTRPKGALPSDTVVNPKDNVEETQEEVNPSRKHIVGIPESVVPKAKAPIPRPPPPYPQRLANQNGKNQFKKFIDMMKSLSINMPLVEALEQMSGYAKFMKDLVTKKRSMNCLTIKMTHQVSAIVHSMSPKLENPRVFTIPCTIGSLDFAKALCDLGRVST